MSGERPEGAMKTPLDDLDKRIKETARSRFIDSERVSKRDQRLSWIVAMASTYVIILTIMPYFVRFPNDVENFLNLATVGLAIVTLVASLIVGSRRDAVNAEQYHRSALELNELQREIYSTRYNALTTPTKQDTLETLRNKYNQILQKYSINHESIDYEKLQLERHHEYPWNTRFDRFRIWIKLFSLTNYSFGIMLILTTFVIWLILIYAIPHRMPTAQP
jgi:hypothetical protein